MYQVRHNRRRRIPGARILCHACILMLFCGPNLHAEIVHGYFVWSGASYDGLDLNQDGQPELSVYNYHQDCPSGCAITIEMAAGCGVAIGPGGLAAGFGRGELIRPELSWNVFATLANYDAGGCEEGIFCEPPTRFLALRFLTEEGYHYAWLRATRPNGSSLYDYAYETRPDTPIAAGAGYPCAGDVDGNLDVDLFDLSSLLGHFGTIGGADLADSDLNGDGDVNLTDLMLLLSTFGTTCRTCDWNDTIYVQRSPAIHPDALQGPMAYDSARGVTVLFGGWVDSGLMSDTWEWEGITWTRRSPEVRPGARNEAAMAYDNSRGVTVLFGGYDSFGLSDGTWEWDGNTWTERNPSTRPAARAGHAIAYDSARDVIVLFGGYVPSGWLDDTWEWDGTTWTERSPATRPAARSGHAMAYDIARHVTLLFGGGLAWDIFDDTWEWDGTTWTEGSQGPLPRAGHAMVYDTNRNVTQLFGGWHYYDFLPETWEWNGTVWRRNRAPGPAASCAMAYDSARRVTVLYGSGATWELEICPP